MNLNFIEEFKNYSNLELLKIIKNPADYQQAAVEAAQAILSTRNISSEEAEKANNEFEAKRDQAISYKEGTFTSILKPSNDPAISRWLKFLWLILALEYARVLYQSLPSFIYYLRCKFCTLDSFWALSFLNIIYIPIVFFLLLRKNKWGWIILFGETVFTGVILQSAFLQQMVRIAKSIYYLDFPRFNAMEYVWFVLIRTFMITIMLREDVANHFKINDQLKLKTIIVATVLYVLFVIGVTVVLYGVYRF